MQRKPFSCVSFVSEGILTDEKIELNTLPQLFFQPSQTSRLQVSDTALVILLLLGALSWSRWTVFSCYMLNSSKESEAEIDHECIWFWFWRNLLEWFLGCKTSWQRNPLFPRLKHWSAEMSWKKAWTGYNRKKAFKKSLVGFQQTLTSV